MGAAIWSATPGQMLACPARFFISFFHHHGMLSVNNRPQWRVIRGGSCRYVEALTRPYRDRIRLNSPVQSIRRNPEFVEVTPRNGKPEKFDQVIIAAHSDQALAMLADPGAEEKTILGAMPYQKNEAILHTDASLLPKRRLAWASWNYHLLKNNSGSVAVTYNMNILQTLKAPRQFCVTLNRTQDIQPSSIIRRIRYHHPVYNTGSIAAQKRHADINGVNRTYFCGAYWGYGFHEDGVNSALAVAKYFGQELG
jgi:predicted NAD/FAD-binding protein